MRIDAERGEKAEMKNQSIARISTHLPATVRSFTWVRNHHYVELEDVDGERTRLDATTILLGDCTVCKERVVALTNNGEMTCTHCRGAVKWRYARPQVAFIAEHESRFMGIDAPKNESER